MREFLLLSSSSVQTTGSDHPTELNPNQRNTKGLKTFMKKAKISPPSPRTCNMRRWQVDKRQISESTKLQQARQEVPFSPADLIIGNISQEPRDQRLLNQPNDDAKGKRLHPSVRHSARSGVEMHNWKSKRKEKTEQKSEQKLAWIIIGQRISSKSEWWGLTNCNFFGYSVKP